MFAQQCRQLIANHLHHLLVRRKLQHHLAADRLLADVAEQLFGHAHVHVSFEQRFADFRKRRVQVFFRELALPAQIFERSLQLLGQVLKHDSCECPTSLPIKDNSSMRENT